MEAYAAQVAAQAAAASAAQRERVIRAQEEDRLIGQVSRGEWSDVPEPPAVLPPEHIAWCNSPEYLEVKRRHYEYISRPEVQAKHREFMERIRRGELVSQTEESSSESEEESSDDDDSSDDDESSDDDDHDSSDSSMDSETHQELWESFPDRLEED